MTTDHNIALTRCEFWLLNCALHGGAPIAVIGSSNSEIEDVFNIEPHGLSRGQLIECLNGMFRKKWIVANDNGEYLTTDKIEVALSEKGRFDKLTQYFLTNIGGSIWEAFTRPDWNLYVDEDKEFLDAKGKEKAIFRCANRERLLEHCERCQYYGLTLITDINLTEIEEWYPFYWKSLPNGFQASFEYEDHTFCVSKNSKNWRVSRDKHTSFFAFKDEWCRWV